MLSNKIFNYLSNLSVNNNREWFAENKQQYTEARTEFEEFFALVIDTVAGQDATIGQPTVKESIFRINRDVRFCHDKRPYKQNFSGFIANGGRKSILPGYYLQFDADAVIFGGGLHHPEAGMLKKVRDEISVFPEEMGRILKSKEFHLIYGELWPERLKSAPKGYAKDHEAIELLKYKSYTATCSFTIAQALSPKFIDDITLATKALHPLNTYLLNAIEAPEEEKIDF